MVIPQKNKDSNTFRFKSFAERVSEIDIRQTALYYIGNENEDVLQNNETYFHQAIRKWTVLNLTEEFNEFCRKFCNIVSLPQLLHKKDIIIDFLLEKLSTATTLSLQPLLEILVSLSRDLREDFSKEEYFQRILDRLISLLNTQNVEQLEWTLICLAYLFKTLKTFLKKNISLLFHWILPLLDERQWPDHIINFAVECFAYIARDVGNQRKLLEVVIRSIDPVGTGGVQGCGRLFFEIIRGVNGNFHTIAQKFLPLIFGTLINPIIEQNEVFYEVVQEMVMNILNFVNPTNMLLFWDSVIVAAKKAIETKVQNEEIIKLIEIIGISVEFKSAQFLTNPEPIVSIVLQIADTFNSSEMVLIKISAVICCILLSNSKITQLDLSRMCKKILAVQMRSVYEHFIWNIKSHPQYEILILPSFLKFFESNLDMLSLELLAKIILFKSPLCEDGRNYMEWKKYPIIVNQPVNNYILSILERNEDVTAVESSSLIAVIAPHIENINQKSLLNFMKIEIQKVMKTIHEAEADKEIHKQTFILAILVENVFHLDVKVESSLLEEIINILMPYCGKENFISSLKLLDLILAFCSSTCKEILTFDLFNKIHTEISNNLYSPLEDFRSLTAHTLNYFYIAPNLISNGLYKLFYEIEYIEPTVYTYREKVMLINKLHPNGEYMKNVTKSYIILDTVKILLGMLYHNFKLLWEPIFEVLQNLVNSKVPMSEFWEIYKFKLESTAKIINKETNDPAMVTSDSEPFCFEIFHQIYKNRMTYENKVDYVNYRNLLWSKIPFYGQVAESKNRDIVSIFLKFVYQEYMVFQEQREITWNLVDANESLNLNNDEENSKLLSNGNSNKSNQYDKKFKTVVETLLVKLNVFKCQVNPKQLYRHNELFQLYLDLLICPNSHLQKLALDCIMAYKSNSLLIYKDHLYNFVDDQKFKDELVNFKINKESTDIQAQHKDELIKILLRILYGKMNTKTAGKNMNNQVKKALILRFLGDCEKEEKMWFLKLALKDYGNIYENDLQNMIAVIDDGFNLKKVWSAKKFKSTLNLIELVYKSFVGLMDIEFLIYMFNIIIYIGYTCQKVLENSDKIQNAKYLIVFKNVRIMALEGVINFFKHFENFHWQENQIKAINKVFVWPYLEKLPFDCIHNPTPLLKLLCTWSYDVKHFQWLIIKNDKGLFSFKFIIDLLMNDKAQPIIRRTILEMIERILFTCYNENGQFDESTLGATIIKPYLQQILYRLQVNLRLKRGKNQLNKRDLNILSGLTYLVKDSDTCSKLIEIFLPILIAKTKSATNEEISQQAILALCNLIKNTANSVDYLKKICVLFVEIKVVAIRKLLCNLLEVISKKYKSTLPHLVELVNVINNLNAWDKRWVEQPDYVTRISTIKNILKSSNCEPVNIDLGVLVVCNCFHFLKYEKDMGLRENSSDALKILIPKLLKDNQRSRKDIDFILNEVILDIIRKIVRDSNDTVRNEGILILGVIAKECRMFHPILNNLHHLGDSHDEELDFFQNITHLQSHRYVKALQKFTYITKNSNEPIHVKTLTQFILPLTSRYFLNEKYASKNALIDAALESISVICKLLPWQQYQILLKYYLQKMRSSNEYQKQVIRIVVTILDSFHFDLSSAHEEKKIIDDFKTLCTTELKVEDIKIHTSKDKTKEHEESLTEYNLVKGEKYESTCVEDLDEELENLESENEYKENYKPKYFTSNTVLGPSAAKKVMHTIASVLIPTLNNSITEKSTYDIKHKLNRKRYSAEREEEEVLRVPIALALVKLLQKLPNNILEINLPGVFSKVCTFLKSPLKSVRMLTRDILKKIMLSLGSKYLPMLLEQLRSLLTRGFQIHVLSVTLHGVLDTLKERFESGHIEICLEDILEVTLNDIFSELIDSKEINKIGVHTPEAKPSSKSYLSLHIAARNIPESCLLDLLIPFKQYLAQNLSQKIVAKIEICFQKIIIGLVENTQISKESLLFFIYGTISEYITELLPGVQKPQLTEKEKETIKRSLPDCFLIPEPPKYRSGFFKKTVKNNAQANAHVLIEFGLELLNITLKRKKILNLDYESFLNPIIPILNNSLESQHIKVTTLALKCFTSIWNSDYKISKCNEYLYNILEQIFKILHKYSTCGTVRKDENFYLVKNTFKAIVALLRNVKNFCMTSDQVGQLLFYIEQDILETERQPIAMTLLKAMIFRKIQHNEIHNVMKSLQEISITSQSNFLRDEMRTVLIQYLIEYPIKKKADGIIKFFAMQLNYETPMGRISAIKFIETVIRKFPLDFLLKKAEFLYLQLGIRLVNEEMSECKIAVAECVEQLISRVDKKVKQRLFDITLMFLDKDQKPAVREMAATLFSRFISVEKSLFLPRIKILFPILVTFLNSKNPKEPGQFVKTFSHGINVNTETTDINGSKKELILQEKQKAFDHELIQVQNCILKLLEFCSENIFTSSECSSLIDQLVYECQNLLGYEHDWVRLNAIKIISHILSNVDCELIGQILAKQTKVDEYNFVFLHVTPENDIKSLMLDLCAQMIPGKTTENLAEEVVKIFLILANILKAVPIKNIKKETEFYNEDVNYCNVHLNWVLRRMRYIIQAEVSKAPYSYVLRKCIFNCFEGLIAMLNLDLIEKLASNILSPLIREMSEDDQNIHPELKQQSLRIGSRLRKSIGDEVYDKLRIEIQTKLMQKRVLRKKEVAIQKVTNPIIAVKRKKSVQKRKELAKKRKIDVINGKVKGKTRKRKIDDELF